jgi:MFS family permease
VADALSWRYAYFAGGGMGLLLMLLRISVFESAMFNKLKERNISRGSLLVLFGNKKRILKYLQSILIGLPMWFVVGILITFSPEFGQALNLSEPVDAGKCVMIFFTAQVAGDIVSGLLSQRLQSRKKVILMFILMSLAFALIYVLVPNNDTFIFYAICAGLGIGNGYWTLFVTVAAELFGTNLRATVATSVPNFVRASVIPLTLLFRFIIPYTGLLYGALILAIIVYTISLVALLYLEETFSKDLNYDEGA